MTDRFRSNSNNSLGQQPVSNRNIGPTNPFIEFKKEEIEQSIPDRFEKQVAKYPDRLAVKAGGHELTYDELNTFANRVAREILAKRKSGEEPIALLLEQGAPLIGAIIGVLKTGKIYVPMDPSSPRERTTYMLEDSRAGLIVTNNNTLSFAKELVQGGLRVINIDEIDSGLSTANLGMSMSPDTAAFILYTSGSTGRPKGFLQNHRNVLVETMNHTNGIHICKDDRMVLVSSCSFADAVKIIYGALLNGASLHPLDIKKEKLVNLAARLIEEEITIYRSIATTFRHFAGALTGEVKFPKLRLIYLGGAPIYKADVALYKKHFSDHCIFVFGLGSSETLTFRWHFFNKDTLVDGNTVPVGYPMREKEVLLLDDAGKEVGLNTIGKIAVKSRYLSPGCWGRPDITKASFLGNTEGGDERIFLTGDLGRLLPDGCLMHLGRKDFRVKIRGFRVEAAEVEMALLDLDNIREAVVLAREDRPGDQRLVAYLVPATEPVPNVSQLRRCLIEKLPDYMIPSNFVILDSLPQLPNGKVNRRGLPAPDRSRPSLETPLKAPRTKIEKKLVMIWEQVLGLDLLGVHDNFFELGGHSLLATQIMSRLRDTFQLELPLRSLFETPTVSALAESIEQGERSEGEFQAVKGLSFQDYRQLLINVAGQRGRRLGALSMIIERQIGSPSKYPLFLIGSQLLPGVDYLLEDQTIYFLPSAYFKMSDPQNFIRAVSEVYTDEILAVRPDGPYILAGYCFEARIAYETAQNLKYRGQVVALLVLVERYAQPDPISCWFWLLKAHFSVHWRRLSPLSNIERVRCTIKRIKRIPQRIFTKQMAPDNLPIMENEEQETIDETISRAVRSRDPVSYSGKVVIFNRKQESAANGYLHRRAWRKLVRGNVRFYMFPGDHNSPWKDYNTQRIIGEKLRDCLNGLKMG